MEDCETLDLFDKEIPTSIFGLLGSSIQVHHIFSCGTQVLKHNFEKIGLIHPPPPTSKIVQKLTP